MTSPFTGRHMLAILILGFGIVVAVNFSVAVIAKRTFGGIVVENSYVASQRFNGWLDAAAEQAALGWTVEASRAQDGRISLSVEGAPASATVTAIGRHPLGRLPDVNLSFVRQGDGRYLSRQPLPVGRWTIRSTVRAGSREFRAEGPLQ